MKGRTITFKNKDIYLSGIVIDKIRKREKNNSAVETRYLVKLKKDDLDFDDESPTVMIVNPAYITDYE